MSISVLSARLTTENKPFNGVTDQAPRATPVSKYLIIYNVRVSFVTPAKHVYASQDISKTLAPRRWKWAIQINLLNLKWLFWLGICGNTRLGVMLGEFALLTFLT